MAESKSGVKIFNIQAGSIYGYNINIRDKKDMKKAILGNSLFLDFMRNNGLVVENGWTRDIIGIDFDYGTKSYEDEKNRLKKKLEECEANWSKKKITQVEYEKKIAFFKEALERVENCKDNFVEKKADEIRIDFYTNGVDVTYEETKRRKPQTIHYKMLFRSTGKAKGGSCMFIKEELYDRALNYIRMGYKLPDTNAPIVEIGAYSSLIASGICGKIKINPENIFVMRDCKSSFKSDVLDVYVDDNTKHCAIKVKKDYVGTYDMFDGQGLIDSSIFPSWAEGYVLLRQHMTKMACFKTNIQTFFKDYYGDKYETATLEDMWGNKHYVKDIQLITTDNAVKWLKFDISYDYWCNKVHEDNDIFGVVKYAHKSKLGDVQKMSYQMVNCLTNECVPELIKTTTQYIELMRRDNNEFLKYLELTKNFSNDHEVLIAIAKANPEFMRSEYFRDRKKKIIEGYVRNFKFGKVIQNADNLVFVGSPYAMLLHTVGESVDKDTTLECEDGAIQCYTDRFDDDEYLAVFRSPHNSRNNLGCLHNKHNEIYKKYFDLGKQILVLNTNKTYVEDRLNGCDFDSDSGYVTNHKSIVNVAKTAHEEYPTIVNSVPQSKKRYDNTPENFAIVDNGLAKAQMAIGTSSNLAQIAQTYMNSNGLKSNKKDKDGNYLELEKDECKDYVCMLAVIAQIAIDNAKRSFVVDVNEEINVIRKKMNVKENKYPKFWLSINPRFNDEYKELENDLKEKKKLENDEEGNSECNKKIELTKEEKTLIEPKNKINDKLECPMNIIYDCELKKFRSKESTLPMEYFFNKFDLELDKRTSRRAEEFIQKYSLDLYNDWQASTESFDDKCLYDSFEEDFDELIKDLRQVGLSHNYIGVMSWLIDRAFLITPKMKANKDVSRSKLNKNKPILLQTLYKINKRNVIEIFSKNLE